MHPKDAGGVLVELSQHPPGGAGMGRNVMGERRANGDEARIEELRERREATLLGGGGERDREAARARAS